MQDNYNDLNNFLNSEGIGKDIPKIRVIVRKRPLNKKEYQKNDIDIIEVRNSQTCIVKELKYILINYRNKVDLTKYIEEHHFNFDQVFDENATNEMVKIIIM